MFTQFTSVLLGTQLSSLLAASAHSVRSANSYSCFATSRTAPTAAGHSPPPCNPRSRWLLLPASLSHLLYDTYGRELPPSFTPPPPSSLPAFPNLHLATPHVQTAVQGPGDVIFVPSGWHHVVYNTTACLSLNHNWFNQFNVHHVW